MAHFLEVNTRTGTACLNLDHIISFKPDMDPQIVQVEMVGGHLFFVKPGFEEFKKLLTAAGTTPVKRE